MLNFNLLLRGEGSSLAPGESCCGTPKSNETGLMKLGGYYSAEKRGKGASDVKLEFDPVVLEGRT
jgi:hypothetical protein